MPVARPTGAPSRSVISRVQKTGMRRMLRALKERIRARRTITVETCLTAVRVLMQEEPWAFFLSHGAGPWSSARLVQPICDLETLEVWVGTRADLRKVREVRHNPYVTVAFQSTRQQANVVLYGIAEVHTEPALRKRFWLDAWYMFFPEGPQSDDYVLIRVVPLRIEVMNFAHSIVAEPFGLAPAMLTRSAGQWQLAARTC